MTDETARERAARGAALLDEKFTSWWRRIDLKRLQMGSCRDCVIGQAVGEYCRAVVELLGLDWKGYEDVDYGFDIDKGESDYAPLERAWAYEVLLRREVGQS